MPFLNDSVAGIAASAKAYADSRKKLDFVPFSDNNMLVRETVYPDAPGLNTRALGSEPNADMAPSAQALEEAAESAIKYITSSPGSGSSGYSGPSADAKLQAQTMQEYMDLVNSIADRNNAWAADQAQKQMDFQERMSRNAHQYEIEDLQKAGLNPVLSAGGKGADTPTGAKAEPDTSNTRLIAEMSMAQMEALGSNAMSLAQGYGSNASNSFKDKLINLASRYFIPALARGIGYGVSRRFFAPARAAKAVGNVMKGQYNLW